MTPAADDVKPPFDGHLGTLNIDIVVFRDVSTITEVVPFYQGEAIALELFVLYQLPSVVIVLDFFI